MKPVPTERAPKFVRLLVVAGAASWCGAVIAAPLFGFESFYGFFSAICHQLPERSWFIGDAPLAVCVRCAAVYLGFLASLVLRTRPRAGLLKLALAANLAEFIAAQAGLDYAAARAAAGLFLGMATAPFVAAGLSEMIQHRATLFHAGGVR